MNNGGYCGKLLVVDLSKGTSSTIELPEKIQQEYLGGKGLGAKLLFDQLKSKVDPLSPENVLMFLTGPATGTLIPCNRFCVVTKSPLTGTFLDSYCGGYFSQEVKFAGYDGLIIKGKSAKPCMIWIDDDNVELKSASHLWGLDTFETYERIKEDIGDSAVKVSCIGPAGENLVPFALIDCEYHRQAGRGGGGAVMGSKNLKAIAVRGTKGIKVAEPEKFLTALKEAYKELAESDNTASFSYGSTVSLVAFSNEAGSFTTRNYKYGQFEKAENLNDEAQRKRVWLRDFACFACPIGCIKIGTVRRGKHRGEIVDNLDYENAAMLGANCCVDNLEAVIYCQKLCDKLGLDAMSTGGVIGFAMDLYQQGIISETDAEGIPLEFGNKDTLEKVIRLIAKRQGIGQILSKGVKEIAKHFGAKAERMAVHVKGLESPGWLPVGFPGQGLAYMTADRGGCHQRGFPMAYEIEGEGPEGNKIEQFSVTNKAKVLIWEQNFLAGIYSFCVCEFSRTGISSGTYARLMSALTGRRFTEKDIFTTGERVWNLIRLFNLREGFSRKDDSLPPRFSEAMPSGPTKGQKFTEADKKYMLDDYYKLRGWNSDGVPTREKLLELGIEVEPRAR